MVLLKMDEDISFISLITEEIGNIFINVYGITFKTTDNGVLYRAVDSNNRYTYCLLTYDGDEVTLINNGMERLATDILNIICSDLGIGKITVDTEGYTNITLTREELRSITSIYRIILNNDNKGKLTVRVMEVTDITERELLP